MIIKKALKPTDIFFLQDKKTLYTCDFRAISESMDYSIPAMWKYENLVPWILKDQQVTANSDYKKIEYVESNTIYEIKKTKNPKISIYEKLDNIKISDGISKLWVAIPHPKADEFAKDRKLRLNYTYKDFGNKNDKVKQKQLLGTLTPSWHEIKSIDHLNKLIDSNKSGFVKRKHGSGGYTVFDIKDVKGNTDFKNLFEQTSKDWFFEEKIDGNCYSIQCVKYKNSKDITIFGYSEQIIADGKYFMGSKIENLDSLDPKIFDQLRKALIKLLPLISNFEGFFGIDFIVDKKDKLFVLEANVRLTAVTVPTLVVNMCGVGSATFHEDFSKSDVSEDDLIVDYDMAENLVDIIKLEPNISSIGKSAHIDLKKCNKIPKSLDKDFIGKIKKLVNEHVGTVSEVSFKNFWPFGWTLCFILEESHCVLSSWYLEKRVLVDIFSCHTDINFSNINNKIANLFGSSDKKISNETVR